MGGRKPTQGGEAKTKNTQRHRPHRRSEERSQEAAEDRGRGTHRNRFYFRNYQDGVQVAQTIVLEPSDREGPLIDFNGHPIPYGPLLRVRSVLGYNVLQLSWTAYQPISLIWDYLFWGDKAQFQLKAKMHSSDIKIGRASCRERV